MLHKLNINHWLPINNNTQSQPMYIVNCDLFGRSLKLTLNFAKLIMIFTDVSKKPSRLVNTSHGKASYEARLSSITTLYSLLNYKKPHKTFFRLSSKQEHWLCSFYFPCLPGGRWLQRNRWGYHVFRTTINPLCHYVTSPPRETSICLH